MLIPLHNTRAESVRLDLGGGHDVTVQFSRDAFGSMRIEAWCPGHPRLFAVHLSPHLAVAVDFADEYGCHGAPEEVACHSTN
jgi:hypothetical protein